MIRIRQTDDVAIIARLHTRCFPGDEFIEPSDKHRYWVATCVDAPVAFAIARLLDEPSVFLERSGVLPSFRGTGLQRRLIRVRERWVATVNAKHIITYANYDNFPSIANLIRCGYLLYDPHYRWAGDALYFIKELVPST